MSNLLRFQIQNTPKFRNESFLWIIHSIISHKLSIMQFLSLSKWSFVEVFFSVTIYSIMIWTLTENSEQLKVNLRIQGCFYTNKTLFFVWIFTFHSKKWHDHNMFIVKTQNEKCYLFSANLLCFYDPGYHKIFKINFKVEKTLFCSQLILRQNWCEMLSI